MDHYTTLVDEMDAGATFLNYLLQYEVLDEQETDEIKALTVRHKKNEKLLDFVMRTTSAQYDKFLEALQESKQGHVSSILEGEKMLCFSKVVGTCLLLDVAYRRSQFI